MSVSDANNPSMVLSQSQKLTATESQAFEQSYDRLKAMCATIATNITRNAGLAEDVVHSCFVKIMEHRDKYFSIPAGKRDGYIVVMVKNKAIDAMRSKANTEISINDLSDKEWEIIALSGVEKIYEDKEGYEHLLKLIKELPPLYQVVFEMRYVEGFSNEEIAQVLDIQKTAVAMQLKRAREMMKKKVNGKAIIAIIIVFLSIGALMFNENVRAATVGRVESWFQDRLAIFSFHGEGIDSDLRGFFWQPTHIPNDFRAIATYRYFDEETGAFSSITFATEPEYPPDTLFIFFSADWMWWFEDESDVTTGGGIGIPIDYVEHIIIQNGGIDFHAFVTQTNEARRRMGGLPISIFWEYGGFQFQMLGNADLDTLVEMALSVVPFTKSE